MAQELHRDSYSPVVLPVVLVVVVVENAAVSVVSTFYRHLVIGTPADYWACSSCLCQRSLQSLLWLPPTILGVTWIDSHWLRMSCQMFFRVH